jgi:pimeloyl-ACP methyl ester carboxylesterase
MSAPWKEREAELPGRGRMRFWEVAGPPGAPTVALLHGLAATGMLNWFAALDALAEHFNVFVVDHRGHGRGIRTAHFRLADCADDVVALADFLRVPSFLAVGYSMGGPIAKLCWSRHKDRVRGLVLCATARHFFLRQASGFASAVFPGAIATARMAPGFFRQRMIDSLLGGIRDEQSRAFVREELLHTDPAAVMQATRALIRFSSHDWVANIDVPTAVLVMTRDRLVPPERQYKLAASIPGARVFEIAGDHFACVRAADRFVPALVQACREVDAAAGRAAERSSFGPRGAEA